MNGDVVQSTDFIHSDSIRFALANVFYNIIKRGVSHHTHFTTTIWFNGQQVEPPLSAWDSWNTYLLRCWNWFALNSRARWGIPAWIETLSSAFCLVFEWLIHLRQGTDINNRQSHWGISRVHLCGCLKVKQQRYCRTDWRWSVYRRQVGAEGVIIKCNRFIIVCSPSYLRIYRVWLSSKGEELEWRYLFTCYDKRKSWMCRDVEIVVDLGLWER